MEHADPRWLGLLGVFVLGCAPKDEDPASLEPAGTWADIVMAANGADSDLAYGDPSLAVNGARGAGCCAGGTDVYSLNAELGRDSLIVAFSAGAVQDGEGPEIAVFENPFDISSGGRFMDPIVVYVSPDGFDFISFPVDYRAPDPEQYSIDPAHWVGFAGITPVLLHEETNPTDPFDAETAGGDGFDFDSLRDGPIADRIRADGATHVLLVPASEEINPVTGEVYPSDAFADGPDIDAIYGAFE